MKVGGREQEEEVSPTFSFCGRKGRRERRSPPVHCDRPVTLLSSDGSRRPFRRLNDYSRGTDWTGGRGRRVEFESPLYTSLLMVEYCTPVFVLLFSVV